MNIFRKMSFYVYSSAIVGSYFIITDRPGMFFICGAVGFILGFIFERDVPPGPDKQNLRKIRGMDGDEVQWYNHIQNDLDITGGVGKSSRFNPFHRFY